MTHRFATQRTLGLLLAFAAAGWLAPGAAAQCVTLSDCELVWSDEFDGTTLDLSKWEPQIGNGALYGLPGWGNAELQYYQAENATVADGALTITAREEQVGDFDYTSARLRTLNRGDWTYGRFEMRAKLPEGQGLWPAFWMLSSVPSTYGVWAASGEIDIMEQVGSEPDRVFGTIHYGGSFPENVFSGSPAFLPPGTEDDFHIYAVEWDVGVIRWYLDGQLYSTRTNWFSTGGPFPAPFDVDFHMLLNIAVGGNLPGSPDATTPFPQDMVVDYVRVYQSDPDATPDPLVVFDDMDHGAPFENGWFQFDGSTGGGGIGANPNDRAPSVGGPFSIEAGFGGSGGFIGGFGRTSPRSLTGMTDFSFWINPDAGQSYTLEVNLQEDDNNDGAITAGIDDEFQFNCVVSPAGPCAIAGGGWQEIRVPLSSFFDDNSFLNGGNGVLDAGGGSEGSLITMVVAVIAVSNGVSFRTDYWTFNGPATDVDGDGVADAQDNCLADANPQQIDTDGDGYGNLCDQDLNNDCVVNAIDLGILKTVFFQADPDADFDSSGSVNAVDLGLMKSAFFGAPGPSGTTPSCSP